MRNKKPLQKTNKIQQGSTTLFVNIPKDFIDILMIEKGHTATFIETNTDDIILRIKKG